MTLRAWHYFGFLLTLFGGTVASDAHVCIPGVFWHQANSSAKTNQNYVYLVSSLETVAAENEMPDDPPASVSPAGDHPKGAPENPPPMQWIRSRVLPHLPWCP
jgi:hypothetical protein